MNDLLRIRSLSKHYDGFDLKDVDLTVPAGSVVGFVGSNGAGKTTTIKAALGLIFPDAGSIELFGQSAGAHANAKTVKRAKQRIGVVLDACSFPEEMTVGAWARSCPAATTPGTLRTSSSASPSSSCRRTAP